MREGDSMEKSEERNKIISKLQTVIKEQIELKEIEIPGTITFQVMSVDGKRRCRRRCWISRKNMERMQS